jgi:hypothetical protein
MNEDGTGFRILFAVGDPYAGVIEGSDGLLYGTTVAYPTVFRQNKNASNFATLHVFSYTNVYGGDPFAGVI